MTGFTEPVALQVVVALDRGLREKVLSSRQWQRLESLAQVGVVPGAPDLSDAEVRELLGAAEVLLTGWGFPMLTSDFLDACRCLRLIVHTGGSVRSFAGPEVFDRGIIVCSQTELNAEPVAEFCLAQILLAAKGVGRAARQYAERQQLPSFDGAEPSDIGVYGATVGLIGYGRVCRRLIELLRPFEVRILLNTPYVDALEAVKLGVELVDLTQIMATADVISVHLGDTPDNHSAITGELLSLVKPGATFINTARGIVVDEPGLVRELLTGRFDAVLDVTWPEIPAADSPLWTLPNVTLTPHWAGSLGRELARLGQGAIDNIEQYLLGLPLTGQIDPALAPHLA